MLLSLACMFLVTAIDWTVRAFVTFIAADVLAPHLVPTPIHAYLAVIAADMLFGGPIIRFNYDPDAGEEE